MDFEDHVCYVPAWWLPGGHLTTLWGRLARKIPPIETETIRVDTPDGDFVQLRRVRSEADAPRLLVLHGLEGTPRSHYVNGTLEQARRRGWGADLLVFRSCSGEPNLRPRFYHSGDTADLEFVLQRLLDEFPGAPLHLAGFSLGGNVLLKWLGERSESVPSRVRAAAAVSVPYDLAESMRHIQRGFSRVYELHFLRSLRRKARAKMRQFPGLLPDGTLSRIRTIYDFDDLVTAPLHGFEGAQDYYSRSSALRWLHGIRVPTLLLSAFDDPFLPVPVLTRVARESARNPWLHAEFHGRGGHVGFISGRSPLRPEYYAELRVVEFLDAAQRGESIYT